MDGRLLSGKVSQCGGGVGRNIADALGKLEVGTFLISAIGNDDFGNQIARTVPHLTQDGLMRCEESTTATCHVICDASGECRMLIGDMDIHDRISVQLMKKHEETIAKSSLVVLDGNIPQETIFYLLDLCGANDIPVWYEPTDIVKAAKAFSAERKNLPDFISPNYYELLEISKVANPHFSPPSNSNWMNTCIEQSKLLAALVGNVIVTLGEKGVLICRKGERTDPFFDLRTPRKPVYRKTNAAMSCSLYAPQKVLREEVVTASGAGDCFASGFIAAMLTGEDQDTCVRQGFRCSVASLKSATAVPEKFV